MRSDVKKKRGAAHPPPAIGSRSADHADNEFVIPANIATLLGPPPVLRTEQAALYSEMFKGFAQCIEPWNFCEWMLVRDITNDHFEIVRWTRYIALVIEAAHKQEVQRARDVITATFISEATSVRMMPALRRARSSSSEGSPTTVESEKGGAAASDESENMNEKARIDALLQEFEPKLQALAKPATDADYAAVAAEWLPPVEQLERLRDARRASLERHLELLDRIRAGLGGFVRQVANDIVEGQFEEVVPVQSSPNSTEDPHTTLLKPTGSAMAETSKPAKPCQRAGRATARSGNSQRKARNGQLELDMEGKR